MGRLDSRSRFVRIAGVLGILILVSGCATSLELAKMIRPECLVMSVCSVTSAEIAVFNPELTDPRQGPTKGPGHALAQIAPKSLTRHGESCAYMVLGTFSWGDASIYAAVKDAKVSRIATVDYATFKVLAFVYSEFCTRVSGV